MATSAHAQPSFTTGEIAERLNAELRGPAELVINRLTTVDDSCADSLTFIRSNRYARDFTASDAAAAIVSRGVELKTPPGKALLVVDDTDLGFIRVLEIFSPPPAVAEPGVHPLAVVDPAADVSKSAEIGPFCVIGAGATIGDGAILRERVSMHADASVGARSIIGVNCVIGARCEIGEACLLHAGVVLGADGFGFRFDSGVSSFAKVPHLGAVVVGAHVEIGANSCIDRGKLGNTLVGDDSKIDNLVQVGHNCVIGRGCLVCGQCGLAGSVVLEDGVVLGGQAGIGDNATIGAGTQVGAQAGVLGNVSPGLALFGTPAGPASEMMRSYALLKKLPDFATRIRALERQFDQGST